MIRIITKEVGYGKENFVSGIFVAASAIALCTYFIIMIYSFTEAKVLGNWTGFSTKLYSSLFVAGTHHSLTNALVNTLSIALIAATVSTLLGSITAIGIFNLRTRARKAISFVNNIPILNGDIIIGISLFLLFVSLGIPQGYTLWFLHISHSVLHMWC